MLVTRIDGLLVFASAEAALDEVRNAILATPTRPELVVLDMGGCYEIDVTAADALAALVDDLRRDGADIRFAGAHHAVREYAERLSHPGLVGLVEPYDAVAAAMRDSDQG